VLTLLQWQIHGLAWLSPMMDNQNQIFAAGILFLQALSVSADKKCLFDTLQNPMGFLLNEWQDGPTGAVNMGLKHAQTV